jgi:uncharacterized SAM-binding protein YcdF (DUF218 family)
LTLGWTRHSSRLRQLANRQGLFGFALGVLSVFLVQFILNNTSAADRIVEPLIRADTGGKADVIVVLGAGLTQLCTPNLYSIRRVVLAVDQFEAGRAPRVVFSGGRPDGLSCSVSEVMARLAQRLGVPEALVQIEDTSRNTWENADRTAALLKSMGARRVLLVTDRLHMRRAEACFASLGFAIERASVPVTETSNVVLMYQGVREYAAWWYYRWRGWIPSDGRADRMTQA